MADKRKTPDPGEGGRRTRSAPTIDLTATDVSASAPKGEPQVDAGETAASSPEPDPPQEQPEAAHKSEPADEHNGSPRREGAPSYALLGQVLLSGFAGAAMMTAALFALWRAGLVPDRYAGATGADAASIGALNERLAKIEGAISKLPINDQSVLERLSATDNAMKSLGVVLTALNKRGDDVAANAADARTRADAAEKAVTELRNSVQDLSKNTSAGLSPSDLDSMQKRLAALEQTTKAAPADKVARLALSAAALRDAVVGGAVFTSELDEVKSLGADEKTVATLAPFAATGVPSPAALAQELRALIPAIVKASGAQAPAGGFLERLEANAGKLVRIRPVDAPAGDDTSAALARVENEAAHAAIDDALTDLGKLDAAARAPAQGWIDKTRARQNALTAARQLASRTAHALGKR
ncbi:MAG: hypothetical protein WBG10_16630 [Pseudolabrys sp.]